jgi:methyltransferase (TIGR00027 family)
MIRPYTALGDPDAQRRLCEGMAPLRRPRPGIWARTRFFDDQVLVAISAGVRQVVICGAGYDDRALRFRSPGVRFFELDHPATQADKARRLQAIEALGGAVLAPADFTCDDAGAVLDAAGHAASQPTLFLCEGLLIYLESEVIRRLLAGLASRATAESSLAASLATHPPGLDSAQVTAGMNAGRRHGNTEPWLTVLPVPDWLRLLGEAGWLAFSQADPVAGSVAPGPGSAAPGPGSADPGAGSADPGAGSAAPGPGSADPGPGSADPGPGSAAEGRSLLVVARPAVS